MINKNKIILSTLKVELKSVLMDLNKSQNDQTSCSSLMNLNYIFKVKGIFLVQTRLNVPFAP